MTGSGPAGELTYPDVKARLARVLAHITDAEAAHEETAANVSADLDTRRNVNMDAGNG